VVSHPGNLDDYLHHQEQRALTQEVSGRGSRPSPPPSAATGKGHKRMEAATPRTPGAGHGPLQKEIAKLEEAISRLEVAQKECAARLADPVLYNDYAKAQPLMATHRESTERLEQLYAQWDAAQARLAKAAPSS